MLTGGSGIWLLDSTGGGVTTGGSETVDGGTDIVLLETGGKPGDDGTLVGPGGLLLGGAVGPELGC